MARLIFDTSAPIAVERNRLPLAACADLDRDDVAMAAVVAAELVVTVRRDGRPRQPHHLVVAAAVVTDRTVVTLDRAGFDGLPGVSGRVPA